MVKYKSNVRKLTQLPVGNIKLMPNQVFETDTDLSGYEKLGYVTRLTPIVKMDENGNPKRGPGRPPKNPSQ